MGRAASVVEQVKDRLSMVDLVGRTVHLHRNGAGHVGLCPFHAEQTPSFRVWEDHATCFGCGWHGDVLTWVQETRGLSFPDALRELAGETGIALREDPETEARRRQHASRTALLRAAAERYHRALPDDARAYLRDRGFTDAFVDAYLIGFAPGGIAAELGPADALRDAGLLTEAGRDALWNRITFPIWGRYEDEVVGLAGRAWPNVDAEPKYVAVPGGPAPLLNERGLRHPAGRTPEGRVVYLAEGDTDTATLVMRGLPAVGVRGAKGFKDDFAPLFEGVHRIYVCADADDRGRELVRRAGELLGNRCRIVELPEGEDVNAYCGPEGRDIAPLAARAPAYLDWLLQRLPADLTADAVEGALAQLVPALARLGPGAREVYEKAAARRLGITVQPVRDAVRAATARAKEAETATAGGDGKPGMVWGDRVGINPNQFVHEGVMHTTLVVPARVEKDEGRLVEEPTPYVVSGRREAFPLADGRLTAAGLSYSPRKVPLPMLGDRWRRSTGPHSLRRFLDDEAHVDPAAVYREVADHFRRYVDYPLPEYHDFLALWVIGTYWFALFRGYPYCHLHGTKRSGKTLTMDIASELAFNALSSASITPAALYRTIEACSPTFLVDEAERLHGRGKKDDDQQDDRMEILKAGYKPGFPVIRCVGDNHEPTSFDVYSPKMFGSISGIESVLGDRMITLHLVRKRRGAQVAELREDQAWPLLHATRDKLYCLMLEHGGDLAALAAEGIDAAVRDVGAFVGWSDLRDRDRELWTPLLTIAVWLDGCAAAEGALDPADGLAARMLRLARASVEERRGREAMEQAEVAILEGLLEYTETHRRDGALTDWHASQHLVTWLKENVEGLAWLERTTRLYAELEKVRVIVDRGKDVKKQRLGDNGRIVACVRVDRDRLLEAAERLGARATADR